VAAVLLGGGVALAVAGVVWGLLGWARVLA
jgi:hypothetical protein